MDIRCTQAQQMALDNLLSGRPIDAGSLNYGGGLKNIIKALHDKGLIDDSGITALGRSVIRAV